MTKLTVDGVEVEVESGSTVLEAAQAAGIEIPTLCHDTRLNPFGACRMCMVEVEGWRTLTSACTTPAGDGMVVRTQGEAIHRIRRTVLELLCIHHPLDCPVCDAAGECNLQNLVFEHGVSQSRFRGQRKEQAADTRNPLVERDLNRCILCAKCVRVCSDVQGVGAIGLSWRGFKTEVSPPFHRSLDCEFCGQCISICPVGALTSKLFKYKARTWFLEKVPSTCPHCSTGCTVNVEAMKGRVFRITSEGGEGPNEGNLCPKGRFGYEFVNSPERLSSPMVKDGGELRPTDWETALSRVAEKLRQIQKDHGPGAVAALASPRLSSEENYLLGKLWRLGLGSNNIDSIADFAYRRFLDGAKQVFSGLGGTPDYEKLKRADTILVVGSNVTESNPVVGNFILKAKFRSGAKILCVNPRASKLTRHADLWVRNAPGSEAQVLAGLAALVLGKKLGNPETDPASLPGFAEFKKSLPKAKAAAKGAGLDPEELEELARAFAESPSALIVLTLHSAENTKGLQSYLAAASLSLVCGHSRGGEAGILVPGETCNIQGLLEVGAAPDLLPGLAPLDEAGARERLSKEWGTAPPEEKGLTTREMLAAAAEGKIKALYIAGENPLVSFPDTQAVQKALERVELLVVQDLFLTETARLAHVVLPGASFAEKDGTVTSAEMRVNPFRRAIAPLPGAREDWRIFSDLAPLLEAGEGYTELSAVTSEIARVAPIYAKALENGARSLRWNESGDGGSEPTLVPLSLNGGVPEAEEYPFVLLTGCLLNHSGSVTRKGPGLTAVSPKAFLGLSDEDAATLEVKDGDRVKVSSAAGSIMAEVSLSAALPRGVLFLPVHFEGPGTQRVAVLSVEAGERFPVRVKVEREKGVFN
jgi:formate dehydrogenase alpha subunit